MKARPEPGNDERPVASADDRGPTRLLDREASARYLSTSTDTVDRLVHAGVLPIVKLPVERSKSGRAAVGMNRRVLLDVRDLDVLIDRSKEKL